jgi:anti-sigma B factor antagonist
VTNAQVTIDEASEIPVVSVVGEIDAATVPLLTERLDQIPDTTSRVVIDLSETTFIDSSGLSALVACRKRLDEPDTVIHLVVTRPSIANLFAITGLLDTFAIVSTIEEAIAKS